MGYEGQERRRSHDTDSDHDLLINITNKINNFVDIFAEQKKEHGVKFKDHEDRIRILERSIWVGIGGLFVLQIFLKFIIK